MRLENVVTVGVLSASHRLRRAWFKISLLIVLLGLALAIGGALENGGGGTSMDRPGVAVFWAGAIIAWGGGIGLFWWLVAGAVLWLGRIVGEDTGLIERRSPVEVEPRGRMDYLD
jgi:hypothetical protein